MAVTKLRNSFLRRFLGSPEDVLYAKRAEEVGVEELTSRWFFKAATGHKGSPSRQTVRITVAPSSLVVFVHGILKLAECVPSRNTQKRILKRRW